MDSLKHPYLKWDIHLYKVYPEIYLFIGSIENKINTSGIGGFETMQRSFILLNCYKT